jgi:hypothetical protein
LLIEAVRRHGIDKIRDAQIECFLLKSLPDGQNSIGGIIDLIANNGSWIMELKMSADLKWADPGQLIYYGLMIGAIQRKYPRRLSFFLPLMPDITNQLTEIEFTEHDFFIMCDRIKNLISMWNKQNFPPTNVSEACHYCDVKEHCTFV